MFDEAYALHLLLQPAKFAYSGTSVFTVFKASVCHVAAFAVLSLADARGHAWCQRSCLASLLETVVDPHVHSGVLG